MQHYFFNSPASQLRSSFSQVICTPEFRFEFSRSVQSSILVSKCLFSFSLEILILEWCLVLVVILESQVALYIYIFSSIDQSSLLIVIYELIKCALWIVIKDLKLQRAIEDDTNIFWDVVTFSSRILPEIKENNQQLKGIKRKVILKLWALIHFDCSGVLRCKVISLWVPEYCFP